MYVCMYIGIHVNVYINVYMCIYIYMHIYIYVHIYVHTHRAVRATLLKLELRGLREHWTRGTQGSGVLHWGCQDVLV